MYRENERWEVTSNEHYAFGIELVREGKTRLKMDEQGSSKDGGKLKSGTNAGKKRTITLRKDSKV